MNNHELDQNLEEILNDFAAAAGPTRENLTEWVRRYPQYAKELVECAVNWSRTERAALSAEPAVDTEALTQRGLGIVRQLLDRTEKSEPPTLPLPDLIKLGEGQGLTRQRIAEALGLSTTLLTKLNRRLIRPTSIPRELITRLADLLQQREAAIETYFQVAPRLAHGAQYRAEQAPSAGEPQDFFEAVRTDTGLTAAQRQHWLNLNPRQH